MSPNILSNFSALKNCFRLLLVAAVFALGSLPPARALNLPEVFQKKAPRAAASLSPDTLELLGKKSLFSEYARKEGRKIFAVYQPWYGTEKNGWSHWKGWGNDPKSSFDAQIASVHHPLIGLYDSSERDLIRHHIELARACGIDGFIVDWYGNMVFHDSYVQTLLNEAEEMGFSIALMYEPRVAKQNRAVMKEHLRYILNHYAESPAYQKVAGVPVIYVFGMVSTGFSAGDYAKVTKELMEEGEQRGKNHVFALVGDSTVKPEYFKAASALFEWINMDCLARNESWKANPEQWEDYARGEAFRVSEDRSDIFVIGSVYGGFDDARLGGGNWGRGNRRYLPDQNGLVAKKTINYTVEKGFPWAIVQTFNDWNEGTEFEPSQELGFSRIWNMMDLSARMKGAILNPHQAVSAVERFALKQSNGQFDKERQLFFKQAHAQAESMIEKLATRTADLLTAPN